MKLTDCPACEAEGSIEAGFMLELDDVVLERDGDEKYWTIVDGKPGSSCRFPEIGVEPLESANVYVQCRECGKSFDVASVSDELMGRWSYDDG